MNAKLYQFRCWPSASTNDTYSNIEPEKMFSGNNILNFAINGTNTFTNVTQLGIQGAPGTRFWLNDAQQSSNEYARAGIVLNWTGIFEIDLSEIGGEINSIIFDPTSQNKYFKNLSMADEINPNNYKLVVDILYNGGE